MGWKAECQVLGDLTAQADVSLINRHTSPYATPQNEGACQRPLAAFSLSSLVHAAKNQTAFHKMRMTITRDPLRRERVAIVPGWDRHRAGWLDTRQKNAGSQSRFWVDWDSNEFLKSGR